MSDYLPLFLTNSCECKGKDFINNTSKKMFEEVLLYAVTMPKATHWDAEKWLETKALPTMHREVGPKGKV